MNKIVWRGVTEDEFRVQVGLMRELGVVQAFGIVLGPVPTPKARLAVLEERSEAGDKAAVRELRIETAREELRARLGQWELSDEKVDELLDPSIFEE